MNTTATATSFAGKTAEEWRADAARCRKTSADSWERSDTDGFMSQWANDTMAIRYDHLAKVAEQGGTEEHTALFDADGKLVPAKLLETRFGWSWGILETADPASRIVGWFNESSAQSNDRRIATNLRKGYRLGTVRVPVALNHRSMETYRTDGGFSADAQVVSVEGL